MTYTFMAVVIESASGGYVAYVEELPGAVAQGTSPENALAALKYEAEVTLAANRRMTWEPYRMACEVRCELRQRESVQSKRCAAGHNDTPHEVVCSAARGGNDDDLSRRREATHKFFRSAEARSGGGVDDEISHGVSRYAYGEVRKKVVVRSDTRNQQQHTSLGYVPCFSLSGPEA